MGQSVSAELITAIILGILQLLLSLVSIWQQRHLGHVRGKNVPTVSMTSLNDLAVRIGDDEETNVSEKTRE